jgi:feruloyl esterase
MTRSFAARKHTLFFRSAWMLRGLGALSFGSALLLAACLGNPSVSGSGAVTQITGCDSSIQTSFRPDANTSVRLVKAFKKGEVLTLGAPGATAAPGRGQGAGAPAGGGRGGGRGGATPASPPVAANDVCVVKLLVGPGHPGPADAPSTSSGIAIEVWLPAPQNWNRRVHVLGGGGCSREGDNAVSLAVLGGTRNSTVGQSPAGIATEEGAVSGMTDTGHTVNDCSFGMNPDGSINTVGWNDFSLRSVHELIVKTKALTRAYYGSAPRYTYWEGFSTGGRQAQTVAQVYPDDVDGILGGAPAINNSMMAVGGIYPSLVYQRELGGVALTAGQRTLLNTAAIAACDMVGGVHLGYIPDPSTCTYDPTKDTAVLCAANGGTNGSADCVTPLQAQAQNKIWYGITSDGSVPSSAIDNGWSIQPRAPQLWYGITRGTASGLANGNPFGVMADHLALVMGDPKMASPTFINATGRGEDGWKRLSYPQLAAMIARGEEMRAEFANLDTNNPDLTALKNSGTKFIHYHGLADTLIPPQGSINYYNRAANRMGGFAAIQGYYRFYLVPSMAHGLNNGSANNAANPPLPTHDQLYKALTDWVEKGIAPGRIDISSAATAAGPGKSRPICPYPQKATYRSGDPNTAVSYACS